MWPRCLEDAVGPGIKIKQFHAAFFRRTCGDECADPGNGGGYHQDRHDRSEPETERKSRQEERMENEKVLYIAEIPYETGRNTISDIRADCQKMARSGSGTACLQSIAKMEMLPQQAYMKMIWKMVTGLITMKMV